MSQPLVSIVVITYNSAAFVIETLESIRTQTYKNLELIISDDCSKDDTVEVCRQWLSKNQTRFSRVELLTVEKNTGIAGNCNRGYAAARGEWIKGIAGDDILLPHCITAGMEYAAERPAQLLLSYIQEFGDGDALLKPMKAFENADNASQQLDAIITKNFYVGSPSMFCRKSLWQSTGGFDEQYPLFEDFPFLIRVLQKNLRIGIIPEILIRYRIHKKSASRTSGTDGYCASYRLWRQQMLIPLLWSRRHYHVWWHHKLWLLRMDPSRSQWLQSYPVYLLFLLLDPVALQERIIHLQKKWSSSK